MTKKENIIVLLSITFCWSSAYIFIKDLSSEFSVFSYLALTSGLAGVVLAVVFRRLFKLINRKTIICSAALSVLIAGNIIFENLALKHLDASAVSALASLNLVLVPMILILKKKYPSRNNIVGILILLAGLVISGNISWGTDPLGLLYVFLSCLIMSMYTVAAADYAKEIEPMLLTILQMCMTAGIGLILWIATEGPKGLVSLSLTPELISYIVIIAFFSKAYAYIMLMYAEKYADAVTVTVIAATDPVVTLLLALIIPSMVGTTEMFSPRALAGVCIIFAGAVVAGSDFLSPAKKSGEAAEEIPAEAEHPEHKIELPSIAASSPGKHAPLFAFLMVTVLFAVLGFSVDIMDFADGYSNLRPENFISVVAGILFGPFGAAGCSVGNLLVDLNSWVDRTIVMGFICNFLAAYLPYKLWKAAAGDELNCHTWKKIGLFAWACLLGSLVTSVPLTLTVELMHAEWYKSLAIGIFANNFGFSLVFGLPCFIIMTLGEPPLGSAALAYRPRCGLRVLDRFSSLSKGMLTAATAFLGICLILQIDDKHWSNSLLLRIMIVLAAAAIIFSCLIPSPAGPQKEESR